jgi:hypothetical protein
VSEPLAGYFLSFLSDLLLVTTLCKDTNAREDEIIEDRVVDSLEGTGTRALLLLAGLASRLADHTALSNKNDVAIRKLLLELTSEPKVIRITRSTWL